MHSNPDPLKRTLDPLIPLLQVWLIESRPDNVLGPRLPGEHHHLLLQAAGTSQDQPAVITLSQRSSKNFKGFLQPNLGCSPCSKSAFLLLIPQKDWDHWFAKGTGSHQSR